VTSTETQRRGKLPDWEPVGANVVFASVTRLAQLEEHIESVEQLPRGEWETGDFAAATVLERLGATHTVETRSGRMAEVIRGDVVVGALGARYATLEAVGDWRDVGEDLRIDALARAGVLGRCTSLSPMSLGQLAPLRYLGHLLADERKLTMREFVQAIPHAELRAPIVLIIGTSM
jgi:hypothetical protein